MMTFGKVFAKYADEEDIIRTMVGIAVTANMKDFKDGHIVSIMVRKMMDTDKDQIWSAMVATDHVDVEEFKILTEAEQLDLFPPDAYKM